MEVTEATPDGDVTVDSKCDRADLSDLLTRLPSKGSCDVWFGGSRYQLTVQRTAAGRAVNMFARQLGGSDFISFNAYRLGGEWTLKPCEMPLAKVRTFLESFERLAE